MSKDNYETGYKKPPKKNQFRKGKSGNPKGRPKRKRLSITLRDVLEEPVIINEGGKRKKMPAKKVALKTLIRSIISGDIKAWAMLDKIAKSSGYYEQERYLDHELTVYENLGMIVIDDEPEHRD